MEAKKTLNKVGLFYGTFLFLAIALQLAIAYVLKNYFREFTMAHSISLTLAMTFVVEHVICFGVLLLMIKKVPKQTLVKRKLGVGKFIAAFFIMYALMEAGGLLGNYIQLILTGDASNDVTELLLSSNPIPRILVIGICAPVVEELTFRKLLVDRLVKYGAVFSVIMSGLMFGLIHGNFGQFFYAFFLGCLFAAIYVKTGNVLYTIILHMIVNMSSSVIGVYVLDDFYKRGMESLPYVIYSVFIFLSAIVGIVMIIIKSKDFVPRKKDIVFEENPEEIVTTGALEETETESLSFKDVFFSPGMYFYLAMVIVMFLINYDIISI